MEDPPQPQDMIMSSLQVQSQIVDESSNPDDVHEKTQAALQSTTAPLAAQLEIVDSSNPDDVHAKAQAALQSTTTAPAKEVRVIDISLDDPHQDLIINIRSSKHQITGSIKAARFETTDSDDGDDDVYQRLIRRVPTHMREDRSGHLYEPVMLSIGPYHHNKTQYSKMDRFKKRVLDTFMEESVAKHATKDRDFYYGKIFERIDEIRSYYEEVGPDKYSNEALTELILCDACFLVSYIDSRIPTLSKVLLALGNETTVKLVERDIWRVDNQIPFFIINHLLQLRFAEDNVHEIVREFLSLMCFRKGEKLKRLSWKDEEEEPLHLLEAYQQTLWTGETGSDSALILVYDVPDQSIEFEERWNNLNRSVAYLQAKGIYIKPSSECIQDIKFTSYYVFAVLYLPILYIDKHTLVLLENLVLFERTQEGMHRSADLASYVTFMNTLIDTAKDVKELRERGILYSDLGSDDEVLKLFKQINAYEMDGRTVFAKVTTRINKHCKSRFKTTVADLFQNYCRGPWAAIAVLAAAAVLCLTFLQTYYTIHP